MEQFGDFVKELNDIIQAPSVESSNIVITPESKPTPTKTIKIVIVSTHVNQVNGYSKVIYNIIKQLSALDWVRVVHFGTQKMVNGEIGRVYPAGVKVIDATAMEKQKQAGFAFSELPAILQAEKPDLLLLYNDLSIVCSYIEEIRKAISERFFKIWAYVDITYKSPPQQMIDILNRDVERIFCFTKGWKEQLKLMGMTRPIDVMNHGLDPSMFRLVPRDLARQSLGLPKEIFLFLSMNKNIPRKRLDLLVMSFVKLIVRFPMKPLYMLVVADKGDLGGFPLFDIFARELKLHGGSVDMLGNRLLITSKDTCYKDEDINLLYNAADVGVSCADGEGFGLCSFEGMGVGVPQIVPAINGYSEYCNQENSMMVTPKLRYYVPQAHSVVSGEAEMVDPEEYSKAMERYAFDENLRKLHGTNARDTVIQYTWNKCCTTFIKRLHTFLEEDD